MSVDSAIPTFPDVFQGWSRQIASLGLAVLASGCIFLSLSRVQKTSVAESPPPVDDVREIALPVEPPPPLVRPKELPRMPAPNLVALEPVRSESLVKLPPLPLVAEDHTPRMLTTPRVDLSAKEFRPTEVDSEFETNHVFNRQEVDQRCTPLVKVRPAVARFMLQAADDLHVECIFIVNRDGSVEGVRLVHSSGNLYLDNACKQALGDWKFTPAVRRGRKVRQWVYQSILFKVEAGSPFETQ